MPGFIVAELVVMIAVDRPRTLPLTRVLGRRGGGGGGIATTEECRRPIGHLEEHGIRADPLDDPGAHQEVVGLGLEAGDREAHAERLELVDQLQETHGRGRVDVVDRFRVEQHLADGRAADRNAASMPSRSRSMLAKNSGPSSR